MSLTAFEAVSEDFPLDGQAVIDYFEDTYIGRHRPGGRDIMQFLRGLAHNISMWRTLLLMFRLYADSNGFF